jgi:hypothetical protein
MRCMEHRVLQIEVIESGDCVSRGMIFISCLVSLTGLASITTYRCCIRCVVALTRLLQALEDSTS